MALAALVVSFGVALGLGLFTFSYAEGLSYFSSDPAACVNCHAMREQFDGWNHSTHKAVATCNDCHTPHRFPDKWIVKGINGFNHSWAFTTGNYPDPIRIKGFNAAIAHENCVACHTTMVGEINHSVAAPITAEPELNCVRCHGNVGHGNPNRAQAPAAPDVNQATSGQHMSDLLNVLQKEIP
jgi:cytochrome c nitrite reductase small subunit